MSKMIIKKLEPQKIARTGAYMLAIGLFACNVNGSKMHNNSVIQNQKLPNIVLILADDLGYNELSCYGQESFSTPNIDRLALEGMRFTDFYAGNTVCAPSRCSLITGKHPGRATIRGNMGILTKDPLIKIRSGIAKNDSTIAEILKRKGYATALCGKWHLEDSNDTVNTWPSHRGFDYVIRERWGGELSYARNEIEEQTGIKYDYTYPYELWVNGEKSRIEENFRARKTKHLDDINTEKGLQFIKENSNRPFFIFFSLKIPHSPEVFYADTGLFSDKGWPECERFHALRIGYLDEKVNEIVNTIDDLGLAENTLIVFTSDNGGHSEGGYLDPETDPCKHDYTFFNSNAPLRGYKRDLYDGGIRVPMIARWKGSIKPSTLSSHIGAFWDMMATFADMAEIEMTYDHDGISILPELLGEEQKEHEYLYWEFLHTGKLRDNYSYGFLQAIRKDYWKAVRYGVNNSIELFDLENDIGEMHNVSSKYPELVSEMDSLFTAVREEHPYFPFGGNLAE